MWLYLGSPQVLPWDRIQKKGKVKSEFIFHTLCRYRVYSLLHQRPLKWKRARLNRNKTGIGKKVAPHLRVAHVGNWATRTISALLGKKTEARVNPVVINAPESSRITYFRCGEKGLLARHCRKSPKKQQNSGSRKPPENGVRRSDSSRPTVSSTQ